MAAGEGFKRCAHFATVLFPVRPMLGGPHLACCPWLPWAQVLVQDLVLKWRSRGSAAGVDGLAASGSGGSLAAKEGLEMEGTVAEREVSLLAGSPDRSAALV